MSLKDTAFTYKGFRYWKDGAVCLSLKRAGECVFFLLLIFPPLGAVILYRLLCSLYDRTLLFKLSTALYGNTMAYCWEVISHACELRLLQAN